MWLFYTKNDLKELKIFFNYNWVLTETQRSMVDSMVNPMAGPLVAPTDVSLVDSVVKTNTRQPPENPEKAKRPTQDNQQNSNIQ